MAAVKNMESAVLGRIETDALEAFVDGQNLRLDLDQGLHVLGSTPRSQLRSTAGSSRVCAWTFEALPAGPHRQQQEQPYRAGTGSPVGPYVQQEQGPQHSPIEQEQIPCWPL